jgi:hypothetical protein
MTLPEQSDTLPITPELEEALRRADPEAHRDLAAMARGECQRPFAPQTYARCASCGAERGEPCRL